MWNGSVVVSSTPLRLRTQGAQLLRDVLRRALLREDAFVAEREAEDQRRLAPRCCQRVRDLARIVEAPDAGDDCAKAEPCRDIGHALGAVGRTVGDEPVEVRAQCREVGLDAGVVGARWHTVVEADLARLVGDETTARHSLLQLREPLR